MTPWHKELTAVASDGVITQMFPTFCDSGPGAGTQGELVRRPMEGVISELTVSGDGTNAGTIELWDASGDDVTAKKMDQGETITNAEMATLVAAGSAKKLGQWTVAGTDQLTIYRAGGTGAVCLKGLMARFSNAGPTGTIDVSINASGLFQKYERHV